VDMVASMSTAPASPMRMAVAGMAAMTAAMVLVPGS
jgi:hypothetical protein